MSDSEATVNHVQQNTVAAGLAVAVVEATDVHEVDVIVDSTTLKRSVAVTAVELALTFGLAVDTDGMWVMDHVDAHSTGCCPSQGRNEDLSHFDRRYPFGKEYCSCWSCTGVGCQIVISSGYGSYSRSEAAVAAAEDERGESLEMFDTLALLIPGLESLLLIVHYYQEKQQQLDLTSS